MLALLCGPAAVEAWGRAHVGWERDLLADLGFGLDLASCAVTGGTADLVFVSPKSGRAVSRAAGQGWQDRLLPLPHFLVGPAASAGLPDILAGFALTGFFLERHGFAAGRTAAVAAALEVEGIKACGPARWSCSRSRAAPRRVARASSAASRSKSSGAQ